MLCASLFAFMLSRDDVGCGGRVRARGAQLVCGVVRGVTAAPIALSVPAP